MSSDLTVSDNSAPVLVLETKTKKSRTPVLPAKFAKFIQFNYFFINQLSEIDDATKKDLFDKLAVFAPVEQQTAIVERFLGQHKSINKEYKAAIAANKKAAAAAAKPKRAKKGVTIDFQNNLVNQLIESANNNNAEAETVADAAEPAPEKPKKASRKPKAEKPAADALRLEIPDAHCDADTGVNGTPRLVDAETSAETTAETTAEKPKKAKSAKKTTPAAADEKPKKAKAAKKTKPAEPAAELEDGEVEAQVVKFSFEGKDYLRGDDNVVYDFQSHEPIGLFNSNDNTLAFH